MYVFDQSWIIKKLKLLSYLPPDELCVRVRACGRAFVRACIWINLSIAVCQNLDGIRVCLHVSMIACVCLYVLSVCLRVCHLYKRLSVHRLSVRPPTRPTDCLYVHMYIYAWIIWVSEFVYYTYWYFILTLLFAILFFQLTVVHSGVHCTCFLYEWRIHTCIHVQYTSVYLYATSASFPTFSIIHCLFTTLSAHLIRCWYIGQLGHFIKIGSYVVCVILRGCL